MVERPPVETAAMAWQTASNQSIPATLNRTVEATVRPRYVSVMPFAVSLTVAKGLSPRSDDSVRKSCMPPTRRTGRMAIAMTMMPMPPNQLSSARHSRTPGGAWSSPTITVPPVVLSPDIDS